jgi:hypothetical protein
MSEAQQTTRLELSERQAAALGEKLLLAPEEAAELVSALGATDLSGRSRVNLDPEKLEKGLAQLVMTVIELLRQLMERQALRRVERGSLDDEAIERLGMAFMRLDERMEELKAIFELSDEDLNLDLGPLGKLM